MTQTPGTSIRTFLAALRGQAALCSYTAPCKVNGCLHSYDFSDVIILDNLVRGMADPEIMSDLLGDSKTDRTLDETVLFIAQKEQGKATQSAVGHHIGLKAVTMPPLVNKRSDKSSNMKHTCWACGGKSHSQRNDRAARANQCPAWTSTCQKCSVKGHYTSCCGKCSSCNQWGHRDSNSRFCHMGKPSLNTSQGHNKPQSLKNHLVSNAEEAPDDEVFDQLCGASILQCLGSKLEAPTTPPVEHHIFNGEWVTRRSEPHPTIDVTITPSPEDHRILGFPISETCRPKPFISTMIADSGCQSCVLPITMAYRMGLSDTDIFPVRTNMQGASGEDLHICGGMVADISTFDVSGSKSHQTINIPV